MRVAVSIIVIIGALLTAALGIKWISDYNDNKAVIQQTLDGSGLDESDIPELKDLKDMVNAAYVMVACGIIAFISVFFIKKLGKITTLILLASGIVPIIMESDSLIVTFLILLGGVLSFFVKPKAKTA